MINKICLIYNYAQHYRKGVFKLLDQELNVDFYFGDKMDDVKKIDYAELKSFKNELQNIKLYSSIYWQKGAVKLVFKGYDKFILLGEYYCLSTWVILLINFFKKKKTYLWTHGWYGNESYLKKIIKKVFFNLSNGVFLYGDYAKALMIKEGFKENKLHVVYNSLNYEEQISLRSELNKNNVFKDYFKNDHPNLIFIGRLTSIKKLDYLLEAQNILKQNNFEVNLVFVGDGEEKNNLRKEADRLCLKNNVWLHGSSYNESEIGNLIYNADICVSPGNVGLTAIHSLAFGTPVITHDNFANQMPEFEAINDGITGAFFKENDTKDLARKIEWWLGNKDKNIVKNECFKVIDRFFNPNFQLEVIKKIINEK